ncbi:MAG: hypothetical protein RBT76_13655 [candidate division Zixibacteria bacterium]|jgi:hypothetical protein|nr:hypothetical protein [candidate division Zixibacteria bacterium]
MSKNAADTSKKPISAGSWIGIGLAVGLGLGFSTGAASGGEFIPALAWNLISFGLGLVTALLFQWALGRDDKHEKTVRNQ